MTEQPLVPVERIERIIFLVRRHKVLLDVDLAAMYGVAVKVLNQAVKRNADRFPADFMFRLTAEEAESLRSQTVTLEAGGRGQHRKYLPFVFTEHGALMAASVLSSSRADRLPARRAAMSRRAATLDGASAAAPITPRGTDPRRRCCIRARTPDPNRCSRTAAG
jgi:hypothetical protein